MKDMQTTRVFCLAIGIAAVVAVSGCSEPQEPMFTTETMILREISIRTFSSTLNDDKNNSLLSFPRDRPQNAQTSAGKNKISRPL